MSTTTPVINPIVATFTGLDADAKALLLGLFTQAHNNIAANPTKETLVAQFAVSALTAPALLPTLETDVIVAINNAILAAVTPILTTPTAS